MTLPSSASALRPRHVGLEEIEAALGASAGLEERGWQMREEFRSTAASV